MARPLDLEEVRLRRAELAKGVDVPAPPFLGPRVIESIALKALVPYVNETMLYQFQWGFRKAGRGRAGFRAWAEKEVRPTFMRMVETSIEQDILRPQAVYGYWLAAAAGNDVILFEDDGTTERARFSLPRQDRDGGLCIADFLRDVESDGRDVIGCRR